MGRLVEEINDLDQRIKNTSEKYHETQLDFALAWNEKKRREKAARIAKRKAEINNNK